MNEPKKLITPEKVAQSILQGYQPSPQGQHRHHQDVAARSSETRAADQLQGCPHCGGVA